MPNVTSVWDFSPGETLTAAKLDDVNCGIHVFSGTATRDAAYGGSQERTLVEGEFAYLADSNTTQYYDGSAWQSLPQGLTLVKTQTIGSAVSSVTVSDAFSASYDNYRILVTGGASSTSLTLALTLGSTSTGYYDAGQYGSFGSSTIVGFGNNNAASIALGGDGSADGLNSTIEIHNPFASRTTTFRVSYITNRTAGVFVDLGGFLNNSTSYTAFTLTCSTGNITGGTIRVYGYKNS